MSKLEPVASAPAAPAHQDAELTLPQPPASGTRAAWVVRIIALLMAAAVVSWSLLGDWLVEREIQKVLEVVLIVAAGLCAYSISVFSRWRTVALERAYSTHLEDLSQRLRSLAYRDALSGLYNHRYFYEQLSHEVERAQRYGHPLSVVMLDMDNFKLVNDSYGHVMGDQLLSLVGQIVDTHVRATDVAARYGGDEFAIILPDTDHQAALATAEKLRHAIRASGALTAPSGGGLLLSVSMGVATCPEDGRTVRHLLQAADRRLYKAKQRTRGPGAGEERETIGGRASA